MQPRSKPTNSPNTGWIEIRATTGKLLCRYDPFQNVVQFKHDGYVQAIELDRLRERFGVPVPRRPDEDLIIGKEILQP